MKTEIRRKERIMNSTAEMELLLKTAAVGRMALSTPQGPYLVALNHLYLDGDIYFHSAMQGRKVEALQLDPRVCFMVDEVGPQVTWEKGCGISQIYRSVICFGRAEFVEDATEKQRILLAMVAKLVPAGCDYRPLNAENIARTAIVRIVVEAMTGKENPLSSFHTVLK